MQINNGCEVMPPTKKPEVSEVTRPDMVRAIWSELFDEIGKCFGASSFLFFLREKCFNPSDVWSQAEQLHHSPDTFLASTQVQGYPLMPIGGVFL